MSAVAHRIQPAPGAESLILLHTQTDSGSVGRVVIGRQKMTTPGSSPRIEFRLLNFGEDFVSGHGVSARESYAEHGRSPLTTNYMPDSPNSCGYFVAQCGQ
jgi:hypothetical protein